MTNARSSRETVAAHISWPDGRELVVTLGQLADLGPARLAGACIRLVSVCPCCGSRRRPSHVELEWAREGAHR